MLVIKLLKSKMHFFRFTNYRYCDRLVYVYIYPLNTKISSA